MTIRRNVAIRVLAGVVAATLATCVYAPSQAAATPIDPGVRGGAAGAGTPLDGLTPDETAFFLAGLKKFVETALVIDGSRDPIASRRFDDLVKEARIVIEPVSEAQARIAREAYRDFGKGSGHPAKLNFGDCFAYAPAKTTGEPLLFKGDDFIHTDIIPARG